MDVFEEYGDEFEVKMGVEVVFDFFIVLDVDVDVVVMCEELFLINFEIKCKKIIKCFKLFELF